MGNPSKREVARRDAARAFGKALRAAREQLGVSQEEFAHQANVDRTYVSFLERGMRQPTLTTIIAMAAVVKVPPERFFAEIVANLGKKR